MQPSHAIWAPGIVQSRTKTVFLSSRFGYKERLETNRLRDSNGRQRG
jgi:hypothetical protein